MEWMEVLDTAGAAGLVVRMDLVSADGADISPRVVSQLCEADRLVRAPWRLSCGESGRR